MTISRRSVKQQVVNWTEISDFLQGRNKRGLLKNASWAIAGADHACWRPEFGQVDTSQAFNTPKPVAGVFRPAYDPKMPVDPAKLSIVHYPHPTLREKAQPIAEVNDEVRAVIQRMITLMHQAPGVGLAAPQVGLAWRLFVANPTGEEGDDRVYINPELSDFTGGNAARDEGCLSLPNISVEVTRPAQATIRATGIDGQAFEETADDLLARIWQHENDHLDGVLIIDKMSPIDRMANKRAIKELEEAK